MAINFGESADTKKRREYLESLSGTKPTTGYTESDAAQNWKKYLQGLNASKPGQSYVASDATTQKKNYLESLSGTKPGQNFVASDATTQKKEYLDSLSGSKPGDYKSDYTQAAKDAMDTLLNRKGFQYDVNEDALYQQMKDNYIQQGKLAMQDTMGQAAAMTGGYGNSYAQSVGQQAYNGYLQKLNDSLPEFYQMALNAYNAEGDQLKDRYSMLANQEAQDYNRYQDAWSRWNTEQQQAKSDYENERNWDYGQFQDAWNRWNTEYQQAQDAYENERAWDYGQFQDAWNRWNTEYQNAQNSYESERNWDYGQYQDAWNRWNTEYQQAQDAYESGRNWDYGVAQDNAALAQAQVNYLISQGITPNAELLAAAGYDQQYIDQVVKANTAVPYEPSYSGGGGGGGGGNLTAQDLSQMYDKLKAAGASEAELKDFRMQATAEYKKVANEAFNSTKEEKKKTQFGGSTALPIFKRELEV